MNDSYLYVITALLPLSACMLVFQVNPYHALVIRGILGAVAALVYALFGAADVALTEALVGTMLAITLYAVAVRSSLTMRLGVLEDRLIEANAGSSYFEQLIDDLRTVLRKHYLRLELVPYTDTQTLHKALMDKEVHGSCIPQGLSPEDHQHKIADELEIPYHTATRVQRLYEIMQTELSSSTTRLTYVNVTDAGEKH